MDSSDLTWDRDGDLEVLHFAPFKITLQKHANTRASFWIDYEIQPPALPFQSMHVNLCASVSVAKRLAVELLGIALYEQAQTEKMNSNDRGR